MALRMIKLGLNADLDGQVGLQEFAGNATLLYYLTEEGPGRQKTLFWKKDFPIFINIPNSHEGR